MKNIKEIEFGIQNIVHHTSSFAEHYMTYCIEEHKPSSEYNQELASAAFKFAYESAKDAIYVCEALGLDPVIVCRDEVWFMEKHENKAAA